MVSITLAHHRLPEAGLLFLTSKETLAKFPVTTPSAYQLLKTAIPPPHIFDVIEGGSDAQANRQQILNRANSWAHVAGVVLIGGFDTLRPEVRSTLDLPDRPANAHSLSRAWKNFDDDRFFVWSDNYFGDFVGDGMPDVPVSRIPCSTDFGFLARVLSATGADVSPDLLGYRDQAYPFADEVYSRMHAPSGPPVHPATHFLGIPTGLLNRRELSAMNLYLVLHGGQGPTAHLYSVYNPAGRPTAVISAGSGSLETAPPHPTPIDTPIGQTVLAASCYGGLPSQYPAFQSRTHPGYSLTSESSVALALLHLGVIGVVSFTGTHYVPGELYDFMTEHQASAVVAEIREQFLAQGVGRPLHEAFWTILLGRPPQRRTQSALALFEAKKAYVGGLPHVTSSHDKGNLLLMALEMKAFWSTICLGLGW